MRTATLCFIYLFLCATCAPAQNIALLHYTTDAGLPSNNVYNVYRDSKGFLWFSTDKGVVRYNGVKFQNFNTSDGLSDNEIFITTEDAYGRIWMMTYNGTLCFYKDGVFHNAKNTPYLNLPVSSSNTTNIKLQYDSSIVTFFGDIDFFVNIEKGQRHIYPIKEIKKTNLDVNLFCIEKLSPNRYKLICGDAVLLIDTSDHLLSVIDKYPYRHHYIKQQDTEYYLDSNRIYAGGRLIDTLPLNFLSNNHLYNVFYDSANLLLGTQRGLYINNSIHLLATHKVSSITKDNSGNYWITTLDDGIYKLKCDFNIIKRYNVDYEGKVLYAYADSSSVYFCTTDNHLYKFDGHKKNCIFYERPASDGAYINTSSLIDNHYNYFSFFGRQYYCVQNINKPIAHVKHYKRLFNNAAIKELYPANSGFYARFPAFIVRYTPSGKERYMIRNIAYATQSVSDRIFAISKLDDGSIWFSTISKVYKTQKDIAYPQPQFGNLSFKWFSVSGNYLVGYTNTNQLVVCNNINGVIRSKYITDQNCTWDKPYLLDSTHILISTNDWYRIITLHPGTADPDFTVTTVEDPFIPVQAEYICAHGTTCYFFKNGSIIATGMDYLLKKAASPAVYFTLLTASGITHPINSNITLPYKQSTNIAISFAALSSGSREMRYEYSISRNNTDNWISIQNEQINLIHPSYGTYVVKVRARTISSNYSAPAMFRITIRKPYWATWYFITFCITISLLFIALLVYYSIQYAIKKKNKEHKEKIKVLRSEYKAMNALMNPHFIFNTLNDVQGLINENDSASAGKYLHTFSELIRQNMHNIAMELIPLKKEIDLLINYLKLEKLRFKNRFDYKIEIDEAVDVNKIFIPPLLIQPLIENSIKHGLLPLQSPDGTVQLTIYNRDNKLYIEVKDNGLGIAHTQKKKTDHESYGLLNVRKRIMQLSIIYEKEISFNIDEITDDAGMPTGTLARIVINE